MNLGRSKFTTELAVRPDDIDMNQHVHASRYQDYVLAARYDQMARCYQMSMEDFAQAGCGWFIRAAHLNYKRPLAMGDSMIVRTWVDDIAKQTVRVQFEITKKSNGKLCCDGWFDYTLITLATGRAADIPEQVAEKYSI